MIKKYMGIFLGMMVIGSVSLTGCSAGDGSTVNHITMSTEYDHVDVSGSSTRKVEPDVAKIIFTIRTESITAEESQSQNTQDTNAVIAKLKELGVADNKIKTFNYNMYPRYDYTYDYETGRDGERVFVGYVVTNTLEVSGLEVDKVGNILTECVKVGINDIDGVEYTYSKYDEVYKEVLNEAIEVAREKADSIASANDIKIGKIKKVTEGWQDTSYRYKNSVTSMNAVEMDSMDYGMSNSFDAMPGEIEINANADVTFEIIE